MSLTDPWQLPVLLVDDEPQMLRGASTVLRAAGIASVLTEDDSRKVMARLAAEEVGVLVLDLVMPYLSGEELLRRVTAEHPEVPVVMMTASQDLETAIDCMRTGAMDYLVKPVEKSRLVAAVSRARELRALRGEVLSLKERLLSGQIGRPEAFASIVTRDAAMHAIFRYIEAVAASPQPVLISGETGTGKELFAQAIHTLSGRRGKFVAVNVAGLDDNVFSDTIFGHRKGAFTGAEQSREGLIAEAQDGTLFLDEIGDLSEGSQVKLLRLLQDGQYYPLGSDQARRSKARVVVATNRALERLTAEGRFRKDLYYRLRTHQVRIPALRERKDDLPLLLAHFLERAAQALGKHAPTPPPELLTLLRTYDFPGNVRELEGMVFDAVAQHAGGVLSLKPFRAAVGCAEMSRAAEPRADGNAMDGLRNGARLPMLKEAEDWLINEALLRAEGNQGIAASMLGITRQALNKRLVRKRSGASEEA